MSNYAKWERESQEPLGPLPGADDPRDEQTVEFDVRAQFAAEDVSEPQVYGPAPAPDGYAENPYDYAQQPELGATERPPGLAAARESLSAKRESLSATAAKVGRWFAALDRRPEYEDAVSERDPIAELASPTRPAEPGSAHAGAADPDPAPAAVGSDRAAGPAPLADSDPVAEPEPLAGSEPAADSEPVADREPVADAEPEAGQRFPTAPLGYNRHAVDQHVAGLERELEELRARVKADPPMSVAEELERIGEQTASILVVAHDKAHETTRIAEQRAQRAIDEAEAKARRITADAERRLRELDQETDLVWSERERLLEDLRAVSATLTRLADEAAERFPADEKAPAAG